MQIVKTVHLVSKFKGIHLCKHEVGQEFLVLFRVVSKIGWIPRTHLEQQESTKNEF